MKWRNRIAQGFSPGSGPNEIALKGRPMRIACQSSLRRPSLLVVGVGTLFKPSAPKTHSGDAHSAALSGRVYGLPNPGLKPWAILYCHFMAMYASLHQHATTPPRQSAFRALSCWTLPRGSSPGLICFAISWQIHFACRDAMESVVAVAAFPFSSLFLTN
jgi:hypothetical protein